MLIEQIYTGCLAQGAYYIESDGEAAVIDPLREVDSYILKAEKNHAKIKYVFETHFHADFVSGHIDLSKKTGAPIVFGPNAKTAFKSIIAVDGQEFKLGKITIKVLHTPGHTMESTCYLLVDEYGNESTLFSGDTLFIGDVGRPDLAQKAGVLSKEDMAGILFDSLRNKILPLSDSIIVYPAHGAGSACGKNMSKETSDTLGNQKLVNYALRKNLSKEDFIKEVTTGLGVPPAYFPVNVLMNREGYESIDDVLERGNQALSPDAFEEASNNTDALLLDTRDYEKFADGFIPNSINIGIDGAFAPWVGALIADTKQKLLIICDDGREEEVVTRLARVGYDFTIGYLRGGFDAWKKSGKEIDTVDRIEVKDLAEVLKKNSVEMLDVRNEKEFESEHVDGARNIPLDHINDYLNILAKKQRYYVHCASGYRSMIFNSILKARGYEQLVNIQGGFKSIKESGLIRTTEFICPTTV